VDGAARGRHLPYLLYIPNGSIFFERLEAASGQVSTAVFFIYLMDGVGYTVSAGIYLYKALSHQELTHLLFLKRLAWFLTAVGGFILVFNSVYFTTRLPRAGTRTTVRPEPMSAMPSTIRGAKA